MRLEPENEYEILQLKSLIDHEHITLMLTLEDGTKLIISKQLPIDKP